MKKSKRKRSPMAPSDPQNMFKRLVELHRKVDLFFQKTASSHPEAFACAAGCYDCCQKGLSVFPVEADFLQKFISHLPPHAQETLHRRARLPDHKRRFCILLDEEGTGKCLIYPFRPIVCRSHGLPLLTREGPENIPKTSVCPKNFKHTTPTQETTMNMDTVNTLLSMINSLYGKGDKRTTLSQILDDWCAQHPPQHSPPTVPK